MSDLTERLREEAAYCDEPDAPNVRIGEPELYREAANRIDGLEAIIADMAYLAACRAPKPGDTHVETFMPVAVWKAYRP